MKESYNIEDTTPLKSEKIKDLVEPLIKEEQKSKNNNKLNKSVNIKTSMDSIDEKNNNELHFNSIDLNKFNENNKIKKIRNEMNEIDKDTEDTTTYYSSTPPVEKLKCQNFVFIIFITFFSSIQFGIYVFVFHLYNNISSNKVITNNFSRNKLYLLFLVLSWKFQIYFIFYLIYAICIYFKQKVNIPKESNKEIDEDSIPLTKSNSFNLFDMNPTFNFRKFKYKYCLKYGFSYNTYFNIFIYTSNIFNFSDKKNFINNFFNFDEILKGISGLIFSYALFSGSYFFYFGIIYLIQSITAMIPYYIKFNLKIKNNNINRSLAKIDIKYFKFIFPLLTSIGFYYLLKSTSNNTNNSYLYLLLILFICVFSQLYTQKKFVQESHNESPFHILFRTYFNFFIISNFVVLIIELVYNISIKNLFFWLTDVYLFLVCFIGFGILGAICYNMLLTFMRIALSNNVIVKLIKYFNLIIIDLLGIFIFRQYDIINKADYFVGILLCGISLFMMDFCELL